MHRIKAPILIIQGDADNVVPLDDANKGYEVIKDKHPKNELYIVKGGDHTFQKKEHTQEIINKTIKWLKSISET